MNEKILLIFFGLIVALAVSSSAEEDNASQSISEEIVSRLIREAEASAKKGKNKTKKKNVGSRRKQRKGKKSKKGYNPRRKGKKGGRKNLNKGKRSRSGRQNTVGGTCLESAVLAMRRWKDIVSNFDKQKKRITKQQKTSDNKKGKKGAFKKALNKIISMGGGNKSALSCSGSANSSGALQLKNLTQTLENCEKTINESCNPENFPDPKPWLNMTLVDECTNSTAAFSRKAKECQQLSKSDTSTAACACWEGSDMTSLSEAVTICNVNTSTLASGLKTCRQAFSNCRQYEDAVVDSLAACSKDSSKLVEEAAALSKNKDALADAKAKIAKNTGSSSRRVRAAATSCAEFIALAQTCEWCTNLMLLI